MQFEEEGPFVDGQVHGQWTLRFASGTVYEGPYVNGKLPGRWTWRWASGSVSTSCFSHGEEIDC